MSNSEELSEQIFVIGLCELLDEGKSDEADKFFCQGQIDGDVEKSLWEIVPAIASRLRANNKRRDRESFERCGKMLETIAKTRNAKETILLLVEQIENSRDEENFRSVLKALGFCILRSDPSHHIDWCTRSIQNYRATIHSPPNEKLPPEGEKTPTSVDSERERIIGDYEAIVTFLQPIVEFSALPSDRDKIRSHLLALHYSLFGPVFCFLRHPPNSAEDPFERALSQMRRMSGNFFKHYGIIEDQSYGRKKNMARDLRANEGNGLFRSEDIVSELAWANYYYYVLNSRVGLENLPCVYDYRYLMQGIFYLANILVTQSQYILVRKGLKVITAIAERINEGSVAHEIFERSIHRDLFDSLTRVMIYCDSDEDRKMALKVFHDLMEIWDYRGRYLIITNLYETAKHSGIFSLLTSITKESIIRCLENGCDLFLGKSLERLIKRICRLPNGVSSDLVEISDEIIAALNLLRFLVIRDRDGSIGASGIIDYLTIDYLKPIRDGIDISRAHWKVKIKDLEEQKRNGEAIMENQEITITVGGQNLPTMPITEKIQFCYQAINALDVMESILVRVNECIEENDKKTFSKNDLISE